MFLKKERDCINTLCSSGNENDYYDSHSGYLFISFKTASKFIKALETLMKNYNWCIVGISDVSRNEKEIKYNKRAKSLQDYSKSKGNWLYCLFKMGDEEVANYHMGNVNVLKGFLEGKLGTDSLLFFEDFSIPKELFYENIRMQEKIDFCIYSLNFSECSKHYGYKNLVVGMQGNDFKIYESDMVC